MPTKRAWTPCEDLTIVVARAARHTWDSIAATLGASRSSVIERANLLGVPHNPKPKPEFRDEDSLNRDPLPAGHPTAWALITDGTLLAGSDYPSSCETCAARTCQSQTRRPQTCKSKACQAQFQQSQI